MKSKIIWQKEFYVDIPVQSQFNNFIGSQNTSGILTIVKAVLSLSLLQQKTS